MLVGVLDLTALDLDEIGEPAPPLAHRVLADVTFPGDPGVAASAGGVEDDQGP